MTKRARMIFVQDETLGDGTRRGLLPSSLSIDASVSLAHPIISAEDVVGASPQRVSQAAMLVEYNPKLDSQRVTLLGAMVEAGLNTLDVQVTQAGLNVEVLQLLPIEYITQAGANVDIVFTNKFWVTVM